MDTAASRSLLLTTLIETTADQEATLPILHYSRQTTQVSNSNPDYSVAMIKTEETASQTEDRQVKLSYCKALAM